MRRGAVVEGEQQSNLTHGALCLTGACASLVLSAVIVRSLGPGIDPLHIVFIQNFVSALIVMAMSLKDPSVFHAESGVGQHLTRGLLVGAALYFGYYALQGVSVADFTAIISGRMVVTTLIRWFFLREFVSGRLWGAVVCASFGVVMFIAPTGDGIISHVGAAIVSMVCVSCATVMIRFMKSERWQSMLFWQSSTVAIGSGSIIVAKGQIIPFELLAPGIVLGIIAWGVQRLTVAAYKSAQASSLQPFDASRILVALALDFAVFQVVPDFYSAVGATIIVLSMLLVFLPVENLVKHATFRCKAIPSPDIWYRYCLFLSSNPDEGVSSGKQGASRRRRISRFMAPRHQDFISKFRTACWFLSGP